MDYIFLAVGTVIIITCFYFVIAPFFSNKVESFASIGQDSTTPLEDIYRIMNDLEMDYLMKKISQLDYERLKGDYHLLAAEYMNQNESVQEATSRKSYSKQVDQEILRELELVRNKRGRKG